MLSLLPLLISVMPSPRVSPKNDKLASLTGPNKGKTHITQCGRAAAVEEHGGFFTGRVGSVLQDGHRQGMEGRRGRKNRDGVMHAIPSPLSRRQREAPREGLRLRVQERLSIGSIEGVFKTLVGLVVVECRVEFVVTYLQNSF